MNAAVFLDNRGGASRCAVPAGECHVWIQHCKRMV